MITMIWQKIKFLTFTPTKQQAFLEDMATLINDGVTAKQAVEIIADSAEGVAVEVAQTILQKISEGKFIADGMQGWFPNHIVEIIRAGEEGGALAKTMASAANALTQRSSATSSLLATLTYPIAVICMGMAVTVFINHSIFESFREILPYEQWPSIGKDVAVLANFIEHWWWSIIFVLIALIILVARLLRTYVGDGRHVIDAIPLMALYRQFIAARFMQTLGLLIANGVVLKKALKILQYSANPYLAWHLLTMEYRLGGGKDNIAEVLDTGLIDRSDIVRLRVIARGKGFEHALIRQGEHALDQSTKTIKIAGRVTGGILLGLGALLAIMLIFGIYTVGFSVGAY